MKPDIVALGARAEKMIEELARFSAQPGRLVRLFLSPQHRQAADHVAGRMRAAGLSVSEDALGTVRGHWPGAGRARKPVKTLLIGSHLDSVIDAGKYDGPLGVVAGILAVEHLARAGVELPFAIDVLAFGDEEGSRFPATLSTSAACVGAFDRATLGLADADGVTLEQAIRAYGKDPGDIAHCAYKAAEVEAYVEVHIEQGPVLEGENQPLGVVTGIVGQSRLRVAVTGEAGHAGTVPMNMRRDALAGAALMICEVERIAKAHAGMVATVGHVEVIPGAVNVIPGRVQFTMDLRSMDERAREAALRAFAAAAQGIARARKLQVDVEPFHEIAAVDCAPALRRTLALAVEDLALRPIHLASGAGHDAQMMASLCPSAMLFVRCRGGISHNPAEYASPADMGAAVGAIIRFVERHAAAQGAAMASS
ncbi:MAG: allantoate amidohydrolase [Proteobacteria bacterium]|nr:allantoate amidohydrolase [Pseudomonadota bacterium]